MVKGNFLSQFGCSWLEEIIRDWPAIRRLCEGDTRLTTVLNKHPDVFKEELESMKGITVKLNIKPDSRPKFLKARPVSYAIRPNVEEELDSLIKNGVLEPVTQCD